jgi:hypothetical protein
MCTELLPQGGYPIADKYILLFRSSTKWKNGHEHLVEYQDYIDTSDDN